VRILFVLASPEYVRFFDGTIRRLIGAGHNVDLVFNEAGHNPAVAEAAQELVGAGRMTVLTASRGFWPDAVTGLRGIVDFVRFLHPAYARSRALRARMERRA
jgi:hypothetical protein